MQLLDSGGTKGGSGWRGHVRCAVAER